MRENFLKILVFLCLLLILTGAVQVPRPVWASMEDAAIFYGELNQHGEWVEYEHYGPVWYPTKVQENWRPYVDGRWTPTEEGYVFETGEPWGWATYHYGNWMPTQEYGWVWVPGRTWYPNTVTWRTSPESEGPDESYIGWAPIPPPNYSPQPGYYPEGYYGGTPYRGPIEKLITAPFWIFIRATSFLLGFAQPYSSAYSYWGCHCLLPPSVVPYYYPRTIVVHNYYTPRYYPSGIMVAGRGCYNWGPPLPYVARVTRIKPVTINNYVRQVNIYQRRNVTPPAGVIAQRPYFRPVVPPAMVRSQPLPRGARVLDPQAARANLAQPHLVNVRVIKDVPSVPGSIPKTRVVEGKSGQLRHGVAGAALPASAMMQTNQQMEHHLRNIPSSQQIEPVSPRARQWQVPQTSRTTTSPPAAVYQHQGPAQTHVTPGLPSAATPRTVPSRVKTVPPGTPQTVTPDAPGVPQEAKGQPKQTPTPEVLTPKAPFPSRAGVPKERFKPGKRQPDTQSRQQEPPITAVTPGQPSGPGQESRYTPRTPAPQVPLPTQVQPQQRPSTQPPQPRPPQRWQQRKYTPSQNQGFGPGGPEMTGVQPRPQQYQPQPPPQMRQQSVYQPQPRVSPRPQPQPQPQVQRPPQPPPQSQLQRPPQPPPQRQMQSQPRPQPRPQPQAQPQVQQQQRQRKQKQQQD